MDAIAQVVKDIIDIKAESKNINGESLDELFINYEIALLMGNVQVLYRYGKLMGFMEWVRLPYVPESKDFEPTEEDVRKGGDVLYIINSCLRDDKRHKVLWRLVHEVRKDNNEIKKVCWHDTKGQLHKFNYIKHKGANNG